MQRYVCVSVCVHVGITCVCRQTVLLRVAKCMHVPVLHTCMLNKAHASKCLSTRMYLVSRYIRVANV